MQYLCDIIEFIKASKKKHEDNGHIWRHYALFTTVTGFVAAYMLSKLDGDKKANKIKKFNSQYFFITLSIFVLLIVANICLSVECKIFIKNYNIHIVFSFIFGIYLFSRANEVFIAFIADAIDQLSPKKNNEKSSLKYYERIPLAMKSYIELVVIYGLLYYILNLFTYSFAEQYYVWDMVYYSGVTITTLGYGEILPTHVISKYLSLYSVINGFSLLIISFTVYVSRSIEENSYKSKT